MTSAQVCRPQHVRCEVAAMGQLPLGFACHAGADLRRVERRPAAHQNYVCVGSSDDVCVSVLRTACHANWSRVMWQRTTVSQTKWENRARLGQAWKSRKWCAEKLCRNEVGQTVKILRRNGQWQSVLSWALHGQNVREASAALSLRSAGLPPIRGSPYNQGAADTAVAVGAGGGGAGGSDIFSRCVASSSILLSRAGSDSLVTA
jgi:hypothetical protein